MGNKELIVKLSKARAMFLDRKSTVVDIINKLCPKDAVGVEIGVYKGDLSKVLLNECNIRYLYLIDPYEGGYANFKESPDNTQKVMDERFKSVSRFFAKTYPERSTFIRKKSEDACSDVPDDLDFIYIDGNHAYEYVLKDLETWVPKVKVGGLVMGDDWEKGFPGVVKAVRYYCRNYDLLELPYKSYEKFKFTKKHVRAPGTGKPVINKCQHTWWSVRK